MNAEPTITYTLRQDDVPDSVRRAALREGKPLEEFVKEGLIEVARRIDRAPASPRRRKPSVPPVLPA